MIQLTYVFPEMSERELRRLIGEIENELGIVPNQIVVNDRCVNYDELEEGE